MPLSPQSLSNLNKIEQVLILRYRYVEQDLDGERQGAGILHKKHSDKYCQQNPVSQRIQMGLAMTIL